VDATRTMLVHAAKQQGLRVIMVTSALKGEGKTMLASHLAVSLARGGFRTLLIDADLRYPAVHRQFNLPSLPGWVSCCAANTACETCSTNISPLA